MNAQFRTLATHFFIRFFDVDSTSPDKDSRARMIQLLAVLSVPGLLISFFMLGDHPAGSTWVRSAVSEADRLWLRIADRYVFVAYAMTAMGLLMAFKWDSLFPDRRDYLILMPLPVSLRRWFAAKVVSLFAFLSLFILAINVPSLLLVPPLVADQSNVSSRTALLDAFIAHAAGTIGGSLFAALSFAALQGLLINVLPPKTFRHMSPHIQMIAIAALVTLLLLTPLVKDSIPRLAQDESPILDYFPLMWFLGLYEALIPGGSLMPRSIVWAYAALYAVGVAVVVFAVTYLIAYRRYTRKILESTDDTGLMPRSWRRAAEAFLVPALLRPPVQLGTFYFINSVSSRSVKHRTITALYISTGVALAVSSLFVLDRASAAWFPFRLSARGVLEAPLILSFVLIAGLRVTFKVPSELNANWIFQTTGDGSSLQFLSAVRKWVLLCRIIPLFALIAVFEFASFRSETAVFHLTFDLMISAFLIECFFLKFNKVPFTCSYSSNKFQMVVLAGAYLYGFTVFIAVAGALKRAVTASLFRMTVSLVVSFAILALLGRRRPGSTVTYVEDDAELLSLSADRSYSRGQSSAGNFRPLALHVRAAHLRAKVLDYVAEFRRGWCILWKSPGLSATAVVLITLVIGGNTTIFSMVHAFISRPAPGVHAQNLVMLGIPSTRAEPFHSYAEYLEFTQSTTLHSLIAYGPERITLSTTGGTSAVFGAYVTANYFEGLGVRLAKGRGFTEADNRLEGSGLVAVISYRVWQEEFQAADDVLGRSVTVNGQPATVVGVAAEHFQGAELAIPEDVWVPVTGYFTARGRQAMLADRTGTNRIFGFIVIGRLAPGVSLVQAQAEFATISSRLQLAFPLANKDKLIRPVPYTATNNAGISHGAPQFLAIFSVITAMTLIVVCANVANLLLARAVVRQREVALRQALGAPRIRILWMLIGEGVAISFVAWVGASLFAAWVSRMAPRFVQRQAVSGLGMRSNLLNMDLSPDLTVLAYAMLLALAGTIFFTAAPAVRAWKQDLLSGLRSSEQSVARGRSWLARGLVVTQLAFSVVLLTGAGLAYRSLSLIQSLDLGFNTNNLLLVTVNPSLTISNREANLLLLERLRGRFYTIPGVQAVSYVRLPVPYIWGREQIRSSPSSMPLPVTINYAGPDYLRVLELAPVLGREFTPDDRSTGRKAAIVNEDLATALWPGQSALGRTIPIDRGKDSAEIVGVAPNARLFGPDGTSNILLLAEQQDLARVTGQAGLIESGETTFYIRYSGSLDAVAPGVHRAVREADERLPVVYMRTMDIALESGRTGVHTVATFLSLFSGGSLLIAAIGLYAAIAFEMKRRTRELGIRVAMGASASQIHAAVLKESLLLTLLGLLAGFVLSLTAGLALRGSLFGVTPTDAPIYVGVFLILAATSLIACYLPARRAARVDPLVTLRHE